MHAGLSRIDASGNYVGDVTGREDEQIEIPGAVTVERLLQPFWGNGQHSAIPSIENRKPSSRIRCDASTILRSYPCTLSPGLTKLP